MKDLLILGAGGFAREARIWAIDCGWNPIAFFSQNPKDPDHVDGCPVWKYLDNVDTKLPFIVAVGNPKTREKLAWLAQEDHDLKAAPAIVHPKAYLGNSVRIGNGSIICPGTIITTNVRIGRHVIVNLNCTIGHDCDIDDFCTIAPGVNLSGNCSLERFAHLGTGSCVREKVSIGENSMLGMGSVLVRDMPSDKVWVGNPARAIPEKLQ